jgi:hypothetical protein
MLALHWNGTKLVDVETMVEWAKTRTWKGMHPIVELSRKVYQKYHLKNSWLKTLAMTDCHDKGKLA